MSALDDYVEYRSEGAKPTINSYTLVFVDEPNGGLAELA